MAGVRWLGFELSAQLRDVDAQVVGLGLIGGPPDLLQQLAVRDELALVADEDLEDMPFGGCEADGVPIAGVCLLGRQVDGEAGGLDDRVLVVELYVSPGQRFEAVLPDLEAAIKQLSFEPT